MPSCAGFGPYSEAAFYHVPSRTLLVTDAVIQVPSQPPEVSQGALHDLHPDLPRSLSAHPKPSSPGDTGVGASELRAEGAIPHLSCVQGRE